MRKWHREMLAIATSAGVDGATVEYGGKHPYIAGTVDAQAFRRAIAGSPSDQLRARTKAACDIRREVRRLMLGH